jgi:phosphoglycerate dehydrogenase-like enzyme
MECRFHVADISVREKKEEDGVYFYPMTSLKELLGNVDYVFLCVPLTTETRGFFGEEQFAAMKEIAIMINTSRGEIVDEDALYEALKEKKIGGAAMDTWYNNPKNPFDTDCKPSLKNPFETLDNLVLSPHRAAMIAGELPHLEDAVMNINRVVDGLQPLNVVSVENKF